MAVFSGISQAAAEAALMLKIERDAGIDRRRIDMQADGPGPSGVGVLDLMDGLEFVYRVDVAAGSAMHGADALHFDLRGAGKTVEPDHVLVLRLITFQIVVVVNVYFALHHRHPSQGAVVSVDHGALAG